MIRDYDISVSIPQAVKKVLKSLEQWEEMRLSKILWETKLSESVLYKVLEILKDSNAVEEMVNPDSEDPIYKYKPVGAKQLYNQLYNTKLYGAKWTI